MPFEPLQHSTSAADLMHMMPGQGSPNFSTGHEAAVSEPSGTQGVSAHIVLMLS
jgi:hypothetical protein